MKELHGTHESAYEYDGASRRVRITEKENGTQTKDERFVWCGSRICQKRASNGTTVVRSYFGNGFKEPALVQTDYFYTRDHLGSVREVVGSDGTTIASRLSYDPWGKVTESGSGALSDFTYTGHYADRATGLNLAWFRAYDPNLGRWLSRDPAGLRGGLNLYGYVNNRPVTYIDKDGRWAIPVVVGFVIVLGALLSTDQPHDVNAGEAATATVGAGLMVGAPVAGAGVAILGGAALGTRELYSKPFDMAQATGLPGKADGPQDAYRHCLASCIAAKNYGEGFASLAGDAYEAINSDDSSNQCSMDKANNASGRGLASSAAGSSSEAACSSACLGALQSGHLQTAP